jgi:hypothetical protein
MLLRDVGQAVGPGILRSRLGGVAAGHGFPPVGVCGCAIVVSRSDWCQRCAWQPGNARAAVPLVFHRCKNGCIDVHTTISTMRRFRYSTFFGDGGRKRSICDGSRPHAFAVLGAALRVLVVWSSYRWIAGVRWFRSSASLPAG